MYLLVYTVLSCIHLVHTLLHTLVLYTTYVQTLIYTCVCISYVLCVYLILYTLTYYIYYYTTHSYIHYTTIYTGKGNEEASEQMNDILAQVATNTETSKNSGNAILYECVTTIINIQSDQNLHVLAINILGRFLLNRDNNIRYVALNSLTRIISDDIQAVQRHRNTIIECLKDPDISIRQRACELIYQLVDNNNVILLTSELLNYLIIAPSDHKSDLISKIIQIIEKYSPNIIWRINTIIILLSICGQNYDDSLLRTAIIFLSQIDNNYHNYVIHKLYNTLIVDTTQQALLYVTIWYIGEYGNLLLTNYIPNKGHYDLSSTVASNNTTSNLDESYTAITEGEILSLLDKCIHIHNSDNNIKSIILNSLIKLTIRLPSPSIIQQINNLIVPFTTSLSIELQQRSLEYLSLLKNGGVEKWRNLRQNILSNIPYVDQAVLKRRRAAFDEDSNSNNSPINTNNSSNVVSNITLAPSMSSPVKAPGASLLDLDDIFGLGALAPATPSPGTGPSTTNTVGRGGGGGGAGSANVDLLADIFSTNTLVPSTYTPTPVPVPPYTPAQTPPPSTNGLLSPYTPSPGLYSAPPPVPGSMQTGGYIPTAGANSTGNLAAGTLPTIIAYGKDGLKVCIQCTYMCI